MRKPGFKAEAGQVNSSSNFYLRHLRQWAICVHTKNQILLIITHVVIFSNQFIVACNRFVPCKQYINVASCEVFCESYEYVDLDRLQVNHEVATLVARSCFFDDYYLTPSLVLTSFICHIELTEKLPFALRELIQWIQFEIRLSVCKRKHWVPYCLAEPIKIY